MAEIFVGWRKVNSTNEFLKHRSEYWGTNYYTVYTDNQTQGRGRQQREWQCNPGEDLAFSFIFLAPMKEIYLPCLSLCLGLAVHRSLSTIAKVKLNLKWPNDIDYQKKKTMRCSM